MSSSFLGLDLSTQRLKAVIVRDHSHIVHQAAIDFDHHLPHYRTTNGVLHGPAHGEVTSPVGMWLEAIDLLMQTLKDDGVDLSSIVAVSGAAQQHGSVYWTKHALASLQPDKSLKDQLFPTAFTVENCPTWHDSSTTEDCERIEAAVGGAQVLADLTGSRAYERFTGNQIAKIRRLQPDRYAATDRISLVSSFIASLFLGAIAPIDVSDASGMNLMNILTSKWDDSLLELSGGPELRNKLGPDPVSGGVVLGRIHRWWVDRWNFNPECVIAPFTGDNAATVVAMSTPGDAILSLGTSTTFLLSIPAAEEPPRRFTTSHLLAHPAVAGGHVAMLCYKNGALVRENVRDRFANGNWDLFNELVESTQPGNGGYFGLYFPHPEIIPPNVVGEFFFKSSPSSNVPGPSPVLLADVPPNAHPRAILESQFLSIKSRVKAILPDNSVALQRLILTGGTSANQTVRQIAADIFGMKVYVSQTKEGAAMGAGILAKYAWWKARRDDPSSALEDMMEPQVTGLQCVAIPKEEHRQVYEELVGIYTSCEDRVYSQ
ncbi:actin-like ATPase domain containing protein [Amanita muscaria]